MVKTRNAYSLHASRRVAGPMKHKSTPKAGARNEQAEYLDEWYDVLEDQAQDHICDERCFSDQKIQ